MTTTSTCIKRLGEEGCGWVIYFTTSNVFCLLILRSRSIMLRGLANTTLQLHCTILLIFKYFVYMKGNFKCIGIVIFQLNIRISIILFHFVNRTTP